MTVSLLPTVAAWSLVVLGMAHLVFGIVKYRAALHAACAAGYVGRFAEPEVHRTAFWFVLFGVPLLLAGHVAVRAAARGDLQLLVLIGAYLFTSSLLGVAAFPKSPFVAALAVSVLLMLSGIASP